MKIIILIFVSILVSNCVFFYPTQKKENKVCETITKQYELKANGAAINILEGCSGEACATILLGALGIAASSFVVSGSYVVVGNTLNWAERTSKCEDSSLSLISDNSSDLRSVPHENTKKPRRRYQK